MYLLVTSYFVLCRCFFLCHKWTSGCSCTAQTRQSLVLTSSLHPTLLYLYLVDARNICDLRVLRWALLDLLPSVHLAAVDADSAEGRSFGFVGWVLVGGCVGQQFWRRNRTLLLLLLISHFSMHYVCPWLCELHVLNTSPQSCPFCTRAL